MSSDKPVPDLNKKISEYKKLKKGKPIRINQITKKLSSSQD